MQTRRSVVYTRRYGVHMPNFHFEFGFFFFFTITIIIILWPPFNSKYTLYYIVSGVWTSSRVAMTRGEKTKYHALNLVVSCNNTTRSCTKVGDRYLIYIQ